jgi:hypothetical protein
MSLDFPLQETRRKQQYIGRKAQKPQGALLSHWLHGSGERFAFESCRAHILKKWPKNRCFTGTDPLKGGFFAVFLPPRKIQEIYCPMA